MKKFACQYNIIRFAPFMETEEFANIGIAIYSPKTSKLEYRLAKKRFRRISNFFEDLDQSIYQATIDNLNAELKRFQDYINEERVHESLGTQVFNELMREKGSILKFSNSRVVLTDDIDKKAEDLFQHYVHRSFVRKPYREKEMAKALKSSLRSFNLHTAYREAVLSDGYHDAKFPFVHYGDEETVKGAIKPIAFEQKSRGKVVEHADTWSTRLRHLTQSEIVKPDRILIAVEEPTITDEKAVDYIHRFRTELKHIGIKVINPSDKNAVIEFAKTHSE